METLPLVQTRPSLVVLPPPRDCSLPHWPPPKLFHTGRHLNPRPRDRHPPANGSTPSLPFSYRLEQMSCSWGFCSSEIGMEHHLDTIVSSEVNVEVLPEQVHAWLFAVRAGQGKAVPAKSLAGRQHGNSRPLRLYPDVMRQSPMCSCTFNLYTAVVCVMCYMLASC